jgi:hypothetical protein
MGMSSGLSSMSEDIFGPKQSQLTTVALLKINSDEEIRADVSKLTLSSNADDPT